jgi:predicted nucleic acid-binding protein
MAGVISLDASVVIAYFDPRDDHHDAACALMYEAGDELAVNPITRAESLVRSAATGLLPQSDDDMNLLGITTAPFTHDAHLKLAELRATTRLRMPDCCVLLTAQQAHGSIATFDDRLASVARRLGIEVVTSGTG